MMLARLAAWLVRAEPPPISSGITTGALLLVLETLLVVPLTRVAPREALGAIFLLGVLLMSTVWGLRLGAPMAVVSAVAFNVFHMPPARSLAVADSRHWVELVVFLVVATVGSALAQLARSRAVEAVQGHQDADLVAGLTHLMLAPGGPRPALPEIAGRIAGDLNLPFAEITLGTADDATGHTGPDAAGHRADTARADTAVHRTDAGFVALPLRHAGRSGALVVPGDLPPAMLRRLRERVVPSLETLLSVASRREAGQAALRANRDELRQLATEQAILRRVAVLVANGAPPADVVAAVAAETALLFGADATRLMRQEAPGTVTVVAEYSAPGIPSLLGRRLTVAGGVTEIVLRTSLPARMDNYGDRTGELADLARTEGFRSSVGAPILVEGRVWGALIVLWGRDGPPPPGSEERLAQFTELVATAVANAEHREALAASRARLVFAADEARRRIERDLHDGVQQRLVSLGLELRAAEALVPPGHDELRSRLCRTTEGLRIAFDDLQEITRGIHPAILSQGGLGSAIKALARRCPLPVAVRAGPRRRLPSCVEVAAYYVVCEALTNAAKHARASSIEVDVDVTSEQLVLSIRDNGSGGADPSLGSGLAGLCDRVEALGGRLRLTSPPGDGTVLDVTLPVGGDCRQPPG